MTSPVAVWLSFLEAWADEARQRGTKAASAYLKAHQSLAACQDTLVHPSETVRVRGIGASIAERIERGLLSGSLIENMRNYRDAIDAGLLKIMAKMGISVLSSYRGGLNFEAVGLSRAMVAEYFPGMQSRISGMGLHGLQAKLEDIHHKGFHSDVAELLPVGGFYKARRTGEKHAWEANTMKLLQIACEKASYDVWKQFTATMRANRSAAWPEASASAAPASSGSASATISDAVADPPC